MPNSQRMDIDEGAPAGRSAVLETDRELQLGPEPSRIDRMVYANNLGLTGPRGQNGFPTSDSESFMGHIPTYVEVPFSREGGASMPGPVQTDDNANIPSPRAGDVLL